MTSVVNNFDNINDDSNEDSREASGASEIKQILLQQSVTMLAYMDHTTHNTTITAGFAEPKMLLGFTVQDLPILIGAAIGALGLIILVLLTIIIWHCCRLREKHDKSYCLDNSAPDDNFLKPNNGNIVHSDSVVFMGAKSNQVSTCAIGNSIFQSRFPISQSVSFQETKDLECLVDSHQKFPKQRPNSQPIPIASLFSSATYSPKWIHSAHSHYCKNPMEDTMEKGTLCLPSIPEVLLKSSETIHDGQPINLYASCNALDGSYAYSSLYSTLESTGSMKTRSLPSWVHSRPRPLSTEDDLNELYAKVSFSKKRKNRMRSDSAAAIAANKSKNRIGVPYAHKDTDPLVDNEAVVVYDERTAL